MIGSLETPTFIADAFDDSFFAAYEVQLSDISVEEQASLALAKILTVTKDDSIQMTYEQVKAKTQAFFANDWVRNDEVIMNRMALEFAQACIGHNHGPELARDNQLGSVFETGIAGLDGDTHNHDAHRDEDDDEIDPKTGKKKKKRSAWVGWFALRK